MDQQSEAKGPTVGCSNVFDKESFSLKIIAHPYYLDCTHNTDLLLICSCVFAGRKGTPLRKAKGRCPQNDKSFSAFALSQPEKACPQTTHTSTHTHTAIGFVSQKLGHLPNGLLYLTLPLNSPKRGFPNLPQQIEHPGCQNPVLRRRHQLRS